MTSRRTEVVESDVSLDTQDVVTRLITYQAYCYVVKGSGGKMKAAPATLHRAGDIYLCRRELRRRRRCTYVSEHPVYLTVAYIVGRPVIGRTRIECIALKRNIRLTASSVLIRDARRDAT